MTYPNDYPPTEQLVTETPATPPSYRDLPTSPPAYHRSEPRKPAKRRRRPLHAQEELAIGAGVTLLALVVAKLVCDLNDVGTNVVDYLLGAVLLALVGVVVVGVGGGLVEPARSRWTRLLDSSTPEPYPGDPVDPRLL